MYISNDLLIVKKRNITLLQPLNCAQVSLLGIWIVIMYLKFIYRAMFYLCISLLSSDCVFLWITVYRLGSSTHESIPKVLQGQSHQQGPNDAAYLLNILGHFINYHLITIVIMLSILKVRWLTLCPVCIYNCKNVQICMYIRGNILLLFHYIHLFQMPFFYWNSLTEKGRGVEYIGYCWQ